MGFYTGRTGKLVYLGKEMAKVRDWSLNTTVNMLNTTTLKSNADTFVPGIKSATGSATLMYYRLESGESSTFEQFTALLNKVMKVGGIETTDRVRLSLQTSAALSSDSIVFDAYITSADLASTAGELTQVSIQFTVDGDYVSTITG
jgi:hypothetical protein